MLDKFLKLFRKPEPIVSIEGLADFLSGEASFLAQKSTIEYCRARAGVQWQKLFSEQAFLRSLDEPRRRIRAPELSQPAATAGLDRSNPSPTEKP